MVQSSKLHKAPSQYVRTKAGRRAHIGQRQVAGSADAAWPSADYESTVRDGEYGVRELAGVGVDYLAAGHVLIAGRFARYFVKGAIGKWGSSSHGCQLEAGVSDLQ